MTVACYKFSSKKINPIFQSKVHFTRFLINMSQTMVTPCCFTGDILVLTIGTIYIEALCCAFVPRSVRPEHGNIHFPKKTKARGKKSQFKGSRLRKKCGISFKKKVQQKKKSPWLQYDDPFTQLTMGKPWLPSLAAHVTVMQVLIEVRIYRLDTSGASERGSCVHLVGPNRGALVVSQPACRVSFHIRSGCVSKQTLLSSLTLSAHRDTRLIQLHDREASRGLRVDFLSFVLSLPTVNYSSAQWCHLIGISLTSSSLGLWVSRCCYSRRSGDTASRSWISSFFFHQISPVTRTDGIFFSFQILKWHFSQCRWGAFLSHCANSYPVNPLTPSMVPWCRINLAFFSNAIKVGHFFSG